MPNTYQAIGEMNPDGTFKQLGNTAPKGDTVNASDVVYEDTDVASELTQINSDLTQNINSIQSQIVPTASIESGETASKAYSKGDFLVKNGILYKVTNAITEGDALTVGENIDSTTVVDELSEIKSNVNLDYSTLRDVVSNVSVTNVKTNVYTVEEDGMVTFLSRIENGSASDGIIIYINNKSVYYQKYKGYSASGLYPVKVGDVIAVDKDSAVTSKITINFIGYES